MAFDFAFVAERLNPAHAVRVGPYRVVDAGEVPGQLAAPTSTVRNSRARATCHPPRLPAAALRHTCVETAEPARPTSRATSTIFAAETPDSFSANSGVNRA